MPPDLMPLRAAKPERKSAADAAPPPAPHETINSRAFHAVGGLQRDFPSPRAPPTAHELPTPANLESAPRTLCTRPRFAEGASVLASTGRPSALSIITVLATETMAYIEKWQ